MASNNVVVFCVLVACVVCALGVSYVLDLGSAIIDSDSSVVHLGHMSLESFYPREQPEEDASQNSAGTALDATQSNLLPDQAERRKEMTEQVASLRKLYITIAKEQAALPSSRRRFVEFRNSNVGFGWGNRVEAQITAFAFALATRRQFVLIHEQFTKAFNAPVGAGEAKGWTNGEHGADVRSAIRSRQARKYNSLLAVSVPDSLPGGKAPRVIQVDDKHHGTARFTFTDVLGKQGVLAANSKVLRRVAVGAFMFINPSDALRAEVTRIRSSIGLSVSSSMWVKKWQMSQRDAKSLVVLQMRSMKDAPPAHAAFMKPERQADMWRCIDSFLKNSSVTDSSLYEIFFTTDEQALWSKAEELLKPYGSVHINRQPFTHTASLSRASQKRKPVPAPIAEWYIMSQADVIICTGTTFCNTASENAGFGGRSYNVLSYPWTPKELECYGQIEYLGNI